MNDFATKHFVASMRLDRTWIITVLSHDDTEPDSAAAWWNDHCDDDDRVLVRGALPFQAIARKRSLATRLLMRVQKEFDLWLADGCPQMDAA